MEEVYFGSKKDTELEAFQKIKVNKKLTVDKLITTSTSEKAFADGAFSDDFYIAKCVKREEEVSILCSKGGSHYGTRYAISRTAFKVGQLLLVLAESWEEHKIVGVIDRAFVEACIKIEKEHTKIEKSDNEVAGEILYVPLQEIKLTAEAVRTAWEKELTKAMDKVEAAARVFPGAPRKPKLSEDEEWEKNGRYRAVNGKEFANARITITLDRMWKTLCDSRWDTPYDFEQALNILQLKDYEGKIKVQHGQKTYNLVRESHGSKIGKESVHKHKLTTLMKRILDGDLEEEDLPVYKNLSKIKMEISQIKEIQVNRMSTPVRLPVTIKFINERKVELTCFSKTIQKNYRDVGYFFAYGTRTRSSLGSEDYFAFAKTFGIKETEALEALRNYHIINQL